MDANGTKFHLTHAVSDWEQWGSVKHGVPLREVFADPVTYPDADIEWNPREANLRLARQAVQFRSAIEQPSIDLENRRGAGRDRYGHWYWIDDERQGIRFCANGENHSVAFWSPPGDMFCEPPTSDKGQFRTLAPTAPAPITLSGLAVTNGHYLVVGVVDQGLLIFDLHRGGPPTLLLWTLSGGQTFLPWDIAATSDGGVLVLDRDNRRYWRLNRYFQLSTTLPDAEEQPPETTFQPKDAAEDAEPRRIKQLVPHVGYELIGNGDTPPPDAPISIESGPRSMALVLNAPDGEPSSVYAYAHDALHTVYPLTYTVTDVDDGVEAHAMHAHDFTYLVCTAGEEDCLPLQAVQEAVKGDMLHLLFVAKQDGNQVIVYQLQPDESGFIQLQPDYLPLRRWREKGLVAAGGQVYYDFGDCWIAVGVFQDCEYATAAVIQSPSNFDRRYRPGTSPSHLTLLNGLPEQPFDSNIIGCVWHRLLLDAEIPEDTQIMIQTRAADEPTLLETIPWTEQPKPYQRPEGAELPYYDPYAARRDDLTLSDRAGTWEILLQGMRGRFVQVQLTLLGTGRATPEIQSLRIWYPRFSYQAHYLPTLYGKDPISASFTERFLANFEGCYTHLEDKIVQLSQLLDPRTTPPDALDWLAKWLGVVMHPLWEEARRRFFIRFAHKLYTLRGTVSGLTIAIRIFLDETVDDRLFDPACLQQSTVRIVEQFLTRDVAGSVFGDPGGSVSSGASVAAAAHRFTVLIPHRFKSGEVAISESVRMVERIIELEKPAHTSFDIKEYWNMFRVGEARLGLDTQIGYSTHFQPLVLGDSIVPDTYLGYPYPYNIQDRFVLERNRVI